MSNLDPPIAGLLKRMIETVWLKTELLNVLVKATHLLLNILFSNKINKYMFLASCIDVNLKTPPQNTQHWSSEFLCYTV
jgi:hypothetical protein